MSEQVEEAVNPGQAIHDALSDEAKAAVDALPSEVFVGNPGLQVAGLFAEVILLCSTQSNRARMWSLICDTKTGGQDFISVNVAGINLLSWSRGQVRIAIDMSQDLSQECRDGIIANQTTRSYEAETLIETHVVVDNLLTEPKPELRAAFDWTVQKYADLNWRRNMRANEHRDDWRVKLAMISGINIPAPSYVPPQRIGLPMSDSTDTARVGSTGMKRFWKISAGRGSVYWPMFRDESIMALSMYDEPVDPTDFPDGRKAFIAKLMSVTSASRPGADSIQSLRDEVQTGDGVLVYTRGEVLGWGQVTGEYHYVPAAADYRHQRAVVWNHVEPISTLDLDPDLQKKLSRRATLFELTSGEFAEATGSTVQHSIASREVKPVTDPGAMVYRDMTSAGLRYSESQIASFYTALQTKGFVILSGISGTGKSKIAQHFAGMLPIVQRHTPERVVLEFVRRVEPYMEKYNLFVVPKELADRYQVPEPGSGYGVKLELDGQVGAGRLQNPKNSKTGDGWSVRLSWKGPLREQFSTMNAESIRVQMRLLPDGRVEHVAITPEFDDAESSEEIETVEIRDAGTPNHLFLPVRPDWRDGKALIGYHNPLENRYHRTRFLEFVIVAGDDYRVGNRNAFFVILDEMNLAHVEYYFADVLSVIESGRDDDGWTVEGIPLAIGEEDADLPDLVHLPPNLYIVGTVNMDETTHPFSPKLLDRAFTIELSDVDFSDYPPAPVDGTADVDDEARQALLEAFTGGGARYPRIAKDEIRALVERHPRFRDHLHALNSSLQRYRMHVGYRVFDEIMQFVANAELNGLFASTDDAFDLAVLMKVLPKFNGSRVRLERPLFELLHWCRQGGVLTPEGRDVIAGQLATLTDDSRPFDTIVVTGSGTGDDWRYPATGRRVALMLQDLYADGFASFG